MFEPYEPYEWKVPASFNFARDVIDELAREDRTGLIFVDAAGKRRAVCRGPQLGSRHGARDVPGLAAHRSPPFPCQMRFTTVSSSIPAQSTAAPDYPEKIDAAVLNVHTLKPFDAVTLLTAAQSASLVVTVEEHWLSGGLGSAVSEVLASRAPRVVKRLGVPDTFAGIAGDHEDLLGHFGLTAQGVADTVRRSLCVDRISG